MDFFRLGWLALVRQCCVANLLRTLASGRRLSFQKGTARGWNVLGQSSHPFVETVEEEEEGLDICRQHPVGERGLGCLVVYAWRFR